MSLGKLQKASQGEAKTRAPIHYEHSLINWFRTMFISGQEFDAILQSLQEIPPDVMSGSGFAGVVPFDWGLRGAIKGKGQGQIEPLVGGDIDYCTGWERLEPDQLQVRIAMIEQYVAALHSQGKVRRVMPYIDFGTQLFGRHTRPDQISDPCTAADLVAGGCEQPPPATDCSPNVPQSAWGFWEFYDHWEAYAEPTGPFGLGPKPSDPKTWLAKWDDHDLDGKQDAAYPDELAGFSFEYAPRKCCVYGPYYRYVVCRNTQGWALWWKQVVQWMARVGYDGAFIDNAYFRRCWNQECQEGYQAWLQENFTPDEIRRYFTTTTNTTKSLLNDPSIEGPWWQDDPGQWRAASWTSWGAQISPNPIFPDPNAYGGRYSCRIEGPGGIEVAVLSHASETVPAGEDMRLTFYYRTEGVVKVKAIIDAMAPPLVLALESGWKQAKIDFHTPPDSTGNVNFNLRFEVKGTGKVWLDEFWLGKVSQPPEFNVELWRPSDVPADPVREWAALTYWSQVADEKLGYLRKQARQVNPKFELFTNGFHAVNVDYFMTERQAIDLNHYRFDVGFFPGAYKPNGTPITIQGSKKPASLTVTETLIVTNIFDYKYIHSQRVPGSFAYHMAQWEYAAEQGFYEHNPDSALLNLAEAAAFGGGAGCDVANLWNNYIRYGPDFSLLTGAAANIRAVEKQFWKFIDTHEHRYSGYRTHADVGIVYHDLPLNGSAYAEFHHIMDLAKGLAGQGVLWDVLTENRCNKKNFSRLRVLIYQDVTHISEAEAQAVLEFIGQGGLVIAAGIVGDNDEWFRMRLPDPGKLWPPVGLPPDSTGKRARPTDFQQQGGMGKLIYQSVPLTADQVIVEVENHLSRTVRMVGNVPAEAVARLRLNAWIRQEGGGTITLHVVNYDVPLGIDKGNLVQPLNNVQISVPLPTLMQIQSVRLDSPESNGPSQVVPFNVANGLVTFEISSLRIYTVAVIE